MNKKKQDPRSHIALNMVGDLFLNSITRFNPLANLPKLNAVQQRLNQRALAAIKSKSPQDRKISVTKVSQLGPGNLWKGLDLGQQKNTNSPGNQQRLQTSNNQSSLSPQQRRLQIIQNNNKKQNEQNTRINKNEQKNYIQRHNNRLAQNNLNDSRYRGQTKQVTGNIVSQNLIKNQKSVRDDFGINDKSTQRKKLYQNQNDKRLNPQSSVNYNNRNMTQSRALSDAKQKRVSFSPQKPKESSVQKKQIVPIKKPQPIKPTPSFNYNPKPANKKQQPYVYVPPQKWVPKTQETNQQQHSQSLAPAKILKSQNKIQTKNLPYQSLSPVKQQIKIQTTNTNYGLNNVKQPIKIKSRQQIIAEQQKNKKANPPATTSTYVYQPTPKPVTKQQEPKVESRKVITQNQTKSIQKRNQVSLKKVQFNIQNNDTKNTTTNSRLIQKNKINTSIVVQQNIHIRKQVTIVRNTKPNNVNLDVSSRSQSPQKNQSQVNIISRKKVQISAHQMNKDWRKIKQNLKYDRSISPSNTNSKKVPERQDVALKMIAQLFLDASTRYFPGLSMLLKRGISKQQIQQMRSKSSDFKINIYPSQKKSPTKQQPKTERKLNWKESEDNKNKQKQNNRVYQGDVTAVQYKVKKPQQVAKQAKKTEQSRVNKSQIQQKPKQNYVSVSLEKNNKKITRDDSIIDKSKRQNSQKSNSIRQSPDVYHRQTSKQDVQDSKKNLAKLKNEAKNINYGPTKKEENYVYQPPTKRINQKPIQSPAKVIQTPNKSLPINKINSQSNVSINNQTTKVQPKQVQKNINNNVKPTTSITSPQKPQAKPIQSRAVIKQDSKNISTTINTTKTPTNSYQPKTQNKPQVKPAYNYSPSKKPQNNNNKKQQSTYVYQPPAKWQPRPLSPQNKVETSNQPKNQPINGSKTSINIVQTPKKPEIIQSNAKQTSSKLINSKSQTSIIQPQQRPIINQNNKPVVNQQKSNPIITPVKPIINKNEQKKPQKNVSIISSKSQTSLIDQSQSQANKKYQNTYQPINKKQASNSGYVYQPASTIRKDNNVGTQPNIASKNQNSNTLRSVQSQKVIKTIDNNQKGKTAQNNMIKRDNKIVIGTSQKPNTSQVTNNKSTIQIKQKTIHTNNNNKSTEFKQPSILSKKFCTIISLILKKRLHANLLFALQKISQQSQRRFQASKHASYLTRSLTNFSQNYQKILKRDAFKLIKLFIITSVNKIIKENKPVQQNNHFSSGRKQSAFRVIFWLLKDKLSSYFQPLRQKYLAISNQRKTKEGVIEALVRVINKRAFIFKKDGFKAIKSYKNQKQAVLQNFAKLLGKIKYTAVSNHFSNFVSKDIKQLGAAAKQIKNVPSNKQNTLQKSKSQQQLYSSTKLIHQQSIVNIADSQNLSPGDQAKFEAKRKQLQKKTNDLQKRKQSLQQQVNNMNKDKRAKTKKNAQLKLKISELQKQIQSQEVQVPMQKSKSRENTLTEQELIPILTRIYAYLFEDSDNTQIVVQRFLSDNQHCFQLPTNPGLLNEWKVINKNSQLKRLIKIYEGQQPRQKRINQILQEQNQLMGKLLRSFVRQRYIWQWVNIIAHE